VDSFHREKAMKRKEIEEMWKGIAAEQRKAKIQGEEYARMICSAMSAEKKKEVFLFFSKHTQLDPRGKVRLRLLRQLSDVEVILTACEIHLGIQNTTACVREEIERRLSPRLGEQIKGDSENHDQEEDR